MRDQWGFEPQCYLEIGSYHGRNPDDPFLNYRLPDGSFKFWLHTWVYDHSPLTMAHWHSPLPWVFNIPPDGEFLSAMHGTGYTKQLPLWGGFKPPTNAEQLRWLNGKLYGAVFPTFQSQALHSYLRVLRKQSLTQQDFWECLHKRHVLYGRNRRQS